jgi:hypothetical protein
VPHRIPCSQPTKVLPISRPSDILVGSRVRRPTPAPAVWAAPIPPSSCPTSPSSHPDERDGHGRAAHRALRRARPRRLTGASAIPGKHAPHFLRGKFPSSPRWAAHPAAARVARGSRAGHQRKRCRSRRGARPPTPPSPQPRPTGRDHLRWSALVLAGSPERVLKIGASQVLQPGAAFLVLGLLIQRCVVAGQHLAHPRQRRQLQRPAQRNLRDPEPAGLTRRPTNTGTARWSTTPAPDAWAAPTRRSTCPTSPSRSTTAKSRASSSTMSVGTRCSKPPRSPSCLARPGPALATNGSAADRGAQRRSRWSASSKPAPG